MSIFTDYAATIRFRDKCLGGVPKDPQVIEGWLRQAGISADEDRRAMLLRTLGELGADVPAGATYEELEAAAAKLANNEANGFKHDEGGLYIEDRQVKALLREATNILFAGERWGATKKGPKSYLAERVFVTPARLYFTTPGTDLRFFEPDGMERGVGHIMTPKGPRSILHYAEYVERAELQFGVRVVENCITPEQWEKVWELGQELGLGASRSQSYGCFDMVSWNSMAAMEA